MDNNTIQQVEECISTRLTTYSVNTDVPTRHMFGRVITQILQEPFSRVKTYIHMIVSTMLNVSGDTDASVRLHFINHIPGILKQCQDLALEEQEYYLIYDALIDIIFLFLKDPDPQIRKDGFFTLAHVLDKYLVPNGRLEQKVLPAIVELAKYQLNINQSSPQLQETQQQQFQLHSSQQQQQQTKPQSSHQTDLQTKAIELMGLLAPNVGPEKTELYFLNLFIDLCNDSTKLIRKCCADIFPIMCKVLGVQITEKQLLLIFLLLAEDSEWGVRKATAESLPKVTLTCSLHYRREHLAPTLFKLMNDSCRWVSWAAFKVLGQFIASFAQPCIIGLAYNKDGDLFITNAADMDFKQQSDPEILNNFKHYEAMFNQSTFPNSQVIQIPNDNTYATAAKNVNPYNKFLAAEAFVNISPMQIMTSNYELLLKNCDPSARVNHLNNFNNKSNNNEAVIETPLPPPPPPLISALSTNNDEHLSVIATANASNTLSSSESTSTIVNNNLTAMLETNLSTTGMNVNELYEENKNINNINNNNSGMIQDDDDDDNDKSIIATTKTSTTTAINSMDNSSCHLRKNTPVGLPLIIKQAIENKSKPSPKKLSRLYHHQSGIGGLQIGKIDDQLPPPPPPPPPETPSIESAPLNIDFQQLSNKQNDPLPPPPPLPLLNENESSERRNLLKKNNNLLTNSIIASNSNYHQLQQQTRDVNNKEIDFIVSINPLRIGDNERKTDDCDGGVDGGAQIDEDTELQEYNSANYWYISPDLPLDFDNLDFDDIFETTKTQWGTYISIVRESDLYKDDVRKFKIQELQAMGVGPFMTPTNFNQDIVPAYLIEYFTSMINFNETDMNEYCAYNFPAVLLTLGRENWHLMHDLLQFLCSDIQWKIRKTMALSIYVIALITGREITTNDLVPIFLGFFKDLDEVKVEALRIFHNFLTVVDFDMHENLVLHLGDCLKTDSTANWRVREELAKQVLILIKTYGLKYNVNCMIYLTGIAVMLLTDKVNSVRMIALDAIVEKFSMSSNLEISHLTNMLIDQFAKNSHWRRRQAFATICHKCILKTSANDEMVNYLLPLSKDKVPNVRLSVAKCLNEVLECRFDSIGQLSNSQYEKFEIARQLLQEDDDHDVRQCAGFIDQRDDDKFDTLWPDISDNEFHKKTDSELPIYLYYPKTVDTRPEIEQSADVSHNTVFGETNES